MNKYYIVAALLIMSCSSGKQKSSRPIMTLDRDSINIGKVKIGDSSNINIRVLNTGNDTLTISGIGYSCGCTDGKVEKNILLPNESSQISIKYKNESDYNEISKSIIIENNSDEPFKPIKIVGRAL